MVMLWLTVRWCGRGWRERRVYLLVIVAGGDGERVAVVRRRSRGRRGRRSPVVMVVPGRRMRVQRAGVVVREERVHVVGHVVGGQRLVPARRRRRRAGRRLVPAPVVRMMVVMRVMSPGTAADHFHAGGHFHAASGRKTHAHVNTRCCGEIQERHEQDQTWWYDDTRNN